MMIKLVCAGHAVAVGVAIYGFLSRRLRGMCNITDSALAFNPRFHFLGQKIAGVGRSCERC